MGLLAADNNLRESISFTGPDWHKFGRLADDHVASSDCIFRDEMFCSQAAHFFIRRESDGKRA